MKGIYIVGGYPHIDKFGECFKSVVKCGYDFIEVGIPFNDPVADGPVIASAINETIENGISVHDIIESLIEFRDVPIKKYIMTYSNIVYSYGIEKFSENLKSVIDGIIIADLPNRMRKLFYNEGFKIPIVPFATLETREKDIEIIMNSDSDFIYFVGIRGTTGAKADFTSAELIEKIKLLRKRTDKKIIIGFGVKTADDVKEAMDIGDGFVVGTEAVRRQKDIDEFESYIESLLEKISS